MTVKKGSSFMNKALFIFIQLYFQNVVYNLSIINTFNRLFIGLFTFNPVFTLMQNTIEIKSYILLEKRSKIVNYECTYDKEIILFSIMTSHRYHLVIL